MKLPPLPPAACARVLQYLLSVRGMDIDDAMDWIENHYTEEERNEPLGSTNR